MHLFIRALIRSSLTVTWQIRVSVDSHVVVRRLFAQEEEGKVVPKVIIGYKSPVWMPFHCDNIIAFGCVVIIKGISPNMRLNTVSTTGHAVPCSQDGIRCNESAPAVMLQSAKVGITASWGIMAIDNQVSCC